MPLAVFSTLGTEPRLGKVIGNALIDLSIAAPDLPPTIRRFLAAGPQAMEHYLAVDESCGPLIPLSEVRLHAPVPDPEKFLAIGMNYRAHVDEAVSLGYDAPREQLWFNKQVSCVNGPYDDVTMPRVSDQLDYEVELAVVIGKACRHVPAADARSVIGGYMIVNDVSVRDWQKRSPTMTLGKSFDTHGPTGPWLTLDCELADPQAVTLRMLVNGEERQRASTGEMIHNIFEQIAHVSTVMTLKPGDILATGTPSGVGLAHTPPRFLEIGDVMRAEITGLGHIENRVVSQN